MSTTTATAEDRLVKLGIHLPYAPAPFGAYVPEKPCTSMAALTPATGNTQGDPSCPQLPQPLKTASSNSAFICRMRPRHLAPTCRRNPAHRWRRSLRPLVIPKEIHHVHN